MKLYGFMVRRGYIDRDQRGPGDPHPRGFQSKYCSVAFALNCLKFRDSDQIVSKCNRLSAPGSPAETCQKGKNGRKKNLMRSY